jgi:hypothetical protein
MAKTRSDLLTKIGLATGLLQLALGGAPTHAWARGGESGAGGADDYRIVPAFFLSYATETPVNACLQVAPGFGVEQATLHAYVARAYQEWSDYLVAKRLDLGGSPHILTRLVLRDTCDGSENLTFYFGVENDETARYKSQFANPFGYAQLTQPGNSFELPLKAKGFVWIAPPGSVNDQTHVPTWNSRTAGALYGLVLHEVGHVFGNGHLDGTVMTERIGQYLEEDSDPTRNSPNLGQYSRIDAQVELVPCPECHTSYTGLETLDPMVNPKDPDASDWVYTFKRLVGRAPSRPLALRFERLGSPEGSGLLTLIDGVDIYPFPVRIVNAGEEHPDSTPLFLGQGGRPIHSYGSVYVGALTALSGEKITVQLNYNMNRRKVILKPQGENEGFYPRPFFTSAY